MNSNKEKDRDILAELEENEVTVKMLLKDTLVDTRKDSKRKTGIIILLIACLVVSLVACNLFYQAKLSDMAKTSEERFLAFLEEYDFIVEQEIIVDGDTNNNYGSIINRGIIPDINIPDTTK